MEKFLKAKLNKITSKELNHDEFTKRFHFEKLEKGFGQTIGVSLRRTLLSSVPGASIFAVEIDGTMHEFSAIKDVKEDAVELILNIKGINLEINEEAIDEDDIFKLKLVSKSGVVHAKDIETPAEIKISNPNHVIAHTSKDKALEMTFYVAYSKGHKTFEENRLLVKEKLGEKRGIIAIDSNYSPVESVNYIVEEVNPGETRVFERLVLDVKTKGNMDPEKAVAYAGGILRSYYSTFENIVELDIDKKFQEEIEQVQYETQLQIPIESLNLSVRSERALKAEGIKTVEELIDRSVSSLKSIDNLGEKSITEIVEVIKEMGLSFKSE